MGDALCRPPGSDCGSTSCSPSIQGPHPTLRSNRVQFDKMAGRGAATEALLLSMEIKPFSVPLQVKFSSTWVTWLAYVPPIQPQVGVRKSSGKLGV